MTSNADLAPNETPEISAQDEANADVARATGVVAAGNIISRVLGLARETALTNLFGASNAVDAFNVAILVPRALYDLLIGGHVNSALVPVLSESATEENEEAFWRLVSVLVSFVTVVITGLVLLLEGFAPAVVGVVSSGFEQDKIDLAANMLRLTAPALIFLSLFAVLSGTLYAKRSFLWPALAGAVFNASIVIVTLTGARVLDIRAAALGWLVGAIAQFAIQLPGLRGARLRLTFNWNHPGLRRIGLLYLPVMFSLIIDTLVIRLFSYNLASQTGEGSISYMNWATTLIQFPHGLVATAISIAILPTLSRQANIPANNTENEGNFKDTLGLGLRLASVLIIPATIGLFVMATPIIDLLFEHGKFIAIDTSITTLALRLYLVGLPFAAVDLLLVYAFYARQDTLTPALIGAFSLAIYMIVAVFLLRWYGLFSLMIADSMKHIVHATVSGYILMRRIDGYGRQNLVITAVKATCAAGVMGIISWWLLPILTKWIGNGALLSEIILVLVSASILAGVFVLSAAVLRINELRWLIRLIRQRVSS